MAWLLWTLAVLNSLVLIFLLVGIGSLVRDLYGRIEAIRLGSLLHLTATNLIRSHLEQNGCLPGPKIPAMDEVPPSDGDLKN